MTDQDLIVFLEARLAEDEAAARATLIDVDGSGDWRAGEHPVVWTVDLYRVRDANSRPVVEAIRSLEDDDDPDNIREYVNGAAVAQHVARHDPARILREVHAKRKLLGRFRRAAMMKSKLPDDKMTEKWYSVMAPNVVDLAAVYDDHPDHRSKWFDADDASIDRANAPDSEMDPFEAADDIYRRWE